MKQALLSALAVGALGLSAAASAQTFFGSERIPGQRSSLVYSLQLSGTSAELTTSYEGERPFTDRETVRRFGDIVSMVEESNKVRHAGSVMVRGDFLIVDLRSLRARRTDNRPVQFRFRINRRELVAQDWDAELYGRTPIRLDTQGYDFTRRDRPDSNWPDRDRPSLGGGYDALLDIPSGGMLSRRVDLRRDGRVTVTTRLDRGGRRYTDEDYRQLGNVLDNLRRTGDRAEHTGVWRQEGDRIFLRLDRLDDRRVYAEMTLRARDGRLIVDAQSQDVYGRARPVLR